MPTLTEWSVQPAVNPETPPKPGDSLTADYVKAKFELPYFWPTLFINGNKKGKSWENSKLDEIHCIWMSTDLTVPAAWAGRLVILDLVDLGGDGIVFMNGKRVGEVLSPNCEIDITSAIEFGKPNRLDLYLTRDYTGISRGYDKDVFLKAVENDTWGGKKSVVKDRQLGLLCQPKLLCRPATAVTDIFIIPSWRQKRLDMEVETTSPVAMDAELSAEITDEEGKTALKIKGVPVKIPAGRAVHKLAAPWSDFKTWELEAPYLYKAQVRIKRKDQIVDKSDIVQFGFREIWKEGIKFMMNGHPMRWRMMAPQGISGLSGLSFAKLMGFNFMFSSAAGPKVRFVNHGDEWLNTLDEQGFGTNLQISPQINGLRGILTKDPEVLADYERHVVRYLKKYRNHPSVLAWYVGYNTFCPIDHISPQGMGRPTEAYKTAYQVKFINAAYDVVKRHDPTRLVYSHADGATGDIATSNIYLNFAPLQEREDWPSMWAESGTLPYMGAEMGAPISGCWWKNDNALLMTEYCAIYQGPDAYKNESEAGLRKTVDYGVGNRYGVKVMDFEKDFHNVTDFYRLFIKNTNRAWRTWGVPGGWLYFYFDFPAGFPRGRPKTVWSEWGVYRGINEVLTAKPEWANEFFDIKSEANKTLLAYIAGSPKHSDKTHAFKSGEKVLKQLAIIYDGPVKKDYKAAWTLEDSKGTKVTSGSIDISVDAGAIVFRPIEFKAPEVTDKTSFTIKMSLKENGVEVQADSFAIQVFPPFKPLKLDKKIALFDPAKKSGKGLVALGISPVEWKIGGPNKDVSLLIIGREGITPEFGLPYTKEDIENGLSVLILEQMPWIWEAMGLRSIETMPRYVFMNDRSHAVFKGLGPEDLINWTGSPDIFPEGRPVRSSDNWHAPKWTNTHAVASSAIQVPEVVGFKPIISCEFDMNYSPLLQWQSGKGQVVFCSLDISDRIGVDPAATLLSKNLLTWMTTESPMPRRERCQYWGDAAGRAMLDRIQLKIDPGFELDKPKTSMLVIGSRGEGKRPAEDALAGFVKKGGRVIYLSRSEDELKELGVDCEKKELVRTPPPAHPLFQGIGQNLLRWRDSLKVPLLVAKKPSDGTVFGDGLFMLSENADGGLRVMIQMDPAELEIRHKDSKECTIAVHPSVGHMRQLLAELLTNAGAPASEKAVSKACNVDMGPAQETLAVWQVLGPFPYEKTDKNDDGKRMLDLVFKGEDTAISGDTNPNIQYLRPDGVGLDWRGTANADPGGFVNLAARLEPKGPAVAYVTKVVKSENARTARLSLGALQRIKVWVNGELVFKSNASAVVPMLLVDIPLKAGDNVISMKIASGEKGFGFQALLAKPQAAGAKIDLSLREIKFYETGKYTFDPYQFIYW